MIVDARLNFQGHFKNISIGLIKLGDYYEICKTLSRDHCYWQFISPLFSHILFIVIFKELHLQDQSAKYLFEIIPRLTYHTLQGKKRKTINVILNQSDTTTTKTLPLGNLKCSNALNCRWESFWNFWDFYGLIFLNYDLPQF